MTVNIGYVNTAFNYKGYWGYRYIYVFCDLFYIPFIAVVYTKYVYINENTYVVWMN